ncbi:MAG: radical SAM protein [Candidatus Competibacteraceae bacterium]|nr:radical SAM protein [Candidatus Competibacteraceae bacterium]
MTAEIKPIYGIQRTRLSTAAPLFTPYSIYVFPSTYCNFKCVYCAHAFSPEVIKEKYGLERNHMSLETYREIIAQIAEFPKKIRLLSLTGQGEPLMNKNIPEMVRIAKEAGVAERIEIISNGRLLSPKMADGLIEAGLDTLRVSLQGLNSQKYQDIGGVKVNFEEFLANIRYFHRNKDATDLFIKIMDVALDPGDESRFYDLFRDCSDRMYVERMLPAYAGVEITAGMQVDYDRYGRKISQRNVCPLAFYMLGIFPEGDVEPCDTIYKPIVLGNVHSERLVDMWRGEKLREFWKLHLRGERYANAKCANCNAPNDVSHPEDLLDADAEALMQRLADFELASST